MKFAHIGDLHIGKRVHDFSMLEDQRVYSGSDDENLCGTESGWSFNRWGCL